MLSEWTRRSLLVGLGGGLTGLALATVASDPGAPEARHELPVRRITRGPGFYWFGYYDKLATDPGGRLVLAHRVGFEGRSPRPEDRVEIGWVDTADGDRWQTFGTSRAWCWQQGAMLQWRPGERGGVVWNDREDSSAVCRILEPSGGRPRTLDRPVYALSPDGRWAVSLDFARLQRMRPGYGYVGVDEAARDRRAPADEGIWQLDLETGRSRLLVSLAELASIPHRGCSLESRWHYVNHLLVSPDGRRVAALHRWRDSVASPAPVRALIGYYTRLVTFDAAGGGLRVLDPSGETSHYVWRDARTICAWTRPAGRSAGFYLLGDGSGDVAPVGARAMPRNGHLSYSPAGDWILNDTYPDWIRRRQELYLFDPATGRRTLVGRFHSPWRYWGEWRCDLHPRWSSGRAEATFDSAHGVGPEGGGRQVYRVDLSSVVGSTTATSRRRAAPGRAAENQPTRSRTRSSASV